MTEELRLELAALLKQADPDDLPARRLASRIAGDPAKADRLKKEFAMAYVQRRCHEAQDISQVVATRRSLLSLRMTRALEAARLRIAKRA